MSRRNWYLALNSVVLAWIVLSLVAVTIHRFVDRPLWLMVHVPLLGAVTAAILVWSQHFTDTLTRRQAPLGRPGLAIRLGLQTVGALAITAGMLSGVVPLVVAGASLVGLAIALHAALLARQLRGALPARFAPLVRYYVAAALVFLGGIVLGGIMAVVDSPEVNDRLATAHLVLNAYGWIGLTVLGTLVLLWPTVLRTRVQDSADAAGRRALPVLLAGLAVAAMGPLLGVRPLVALGMLVWLVGAALVGAEGVRQARATPPASFAGYSLGAAYGWLVVAAATLGVQALTARDWASLHEGYLTAIGPLVAGFAVQIVMGALSYLLPVVAMGSPAGAKAAAEVLERGSAFRAVAFNGSILLSLLPLPGLAHTLLSLVAAAMVLAFLVFVVGALVVGRRVRPADGGTPGRGRIAPNAQVSRRRRRSAAVTAALAVLALCVAGGIAADPTAVGIGGTAHDELVPSGQTTEITVRVSGMHFTPSVLEVPYGDLLVVTFENTGTVVHDLVFANGVQTERMWPGGSETVEVGIMGADMDGWCSIAGHRQMGMELRVVITGAPEPGAALSP